MPRPYAHTTRCIKHDRQPPVDIDGACQTMRTSLEAGVKMIMEHYLNRRTTTGSVYVGVEGIALMNIYLADLSLRNLSMDKEYLLDSAKQSLAQSLSMRDSSPLNRILDASHAAFLETSTGVATLVLLCELHRQESSFGDKAISASLEIVADAVNASTSELRKQNDNADPGDGCEVLYGRAGVLYALLALRLAHKIFGNAEKLPGMNQIISLEIIQALVDDIVSRGKAGAVAFKTQLSQREDEAPALMWSWHGKHYLGGAHGVAGILQMLLSAPSQVIRPHLLLIMNTISWLLTLQDRHGNWPTKAPVDAVKHTSEEMIQWCHGAPGIIILLALVLRRSATSKTIASSLSLNLKSSIASSLQSGTNIVYEKGLLRKGVGLCHGVAGNVFALLAASKACSMQEDDDSMRALAELCMQRAIHLAYLATDWELLTRRGEMQVPDRRWSLYEGLAGMCCAWAASLAMLQDQNGSPRASQVVWMGMPGYDDVDY